MKKINLLLLGFLFGFLFLTTSCKEDEETITPTVNESEVLAKYLESTDSPYGKDYVNTDMPSIMPASEVQSLNVQNKVYIIDIRAVADFNKGHIANAHNVTVADVLTHIKTVDLSGYDKVAIVCYTGQTAGYAAGILRLLGYEKVFSMKWGMSSWHSDFDKWTANLSSGKQPQFVTTDFAKGAKGAMPTLTTGLTDAQDILEVRADSLLAQGFDKAKITNTAVFDNTSNYYIVNYWSTAHYAIGHIPGAMQYTPKESMLFDVDLTTLPTDKTIVVYCYTGQTSAFLAAYLRLLGYDAKSLLFGGNGMIYNLMVDNSMTVFKATDIMGYEYVVTQ